MTQSNERPVIELRELPGHIKPHYERLALVANRSHIDRLDLDDPDTLVVCCNWLLWQQELARGRHIVHFELGMSEWNVPDSLCTDLFIHANDWLHKSNVEDPTVFRNVSLGRLFGSEMSMSLMNYYRLDRSLRTLIKRFRPNQIWFFDFIYDINLLSDAMRKWVVDSVAKDCGLSVIDRSGEVPPADHETGETIVPRGHGPFAFFLLSIYSWILEIGTGLRCLFSRNEERVLILVNSNLAEPLARNFSGGGLTPIFIGRTIPRKIRLLWHCFWQGVLLVAPWGTSLSRDDKARVAEIRETLDRFLMVSSDDAVGFAHAYIRNQVLETRKLLENAEEVRKAERLLDRYRPTRIVVDGVKGPRHLIYIELAGARNIAVDYIWHSPHTPQSKKLGALGGDPRQPVFVTRCLSWGRINEKWLHRVEARPPWVRVGSPLRDKYIRDKYNGLVSEPASSANRPGDKNILLLQYAFINSDLTGLSVNMFENFVNTVRELRRLGYVNIRFKMHPAPNRWKKSYFEKIARTFGLECEILRTELFHECLKWADIVIGPAQTGAMFETLAAGKPYHAFMLPPNSFDPGYFDGFPLLTSLDQLPDALEKDTKDESRKLLDDLYSVEEIPNPSKRFWEVLRHDVA